MTSVASTPLIALAALPPVAPAKAARAADGDYKTKGVGHEVKDADGDYKPTSGTGSAAFSTASSTLAVLSAMKLGG